MAIVSSINTSGITTTNHISSYQRAIRLYRHNPQQSASLMRGAIHTALRRKNNSYLTSEVRKADQFFSKSHTTSQYKRAAERYIEIYEAMFLARTDCYSGIRTRANDKAKPQQKEIQIQVEGALDKLNPTNFKQICRKIFKQEELDDIEKSLFNKYLEKLGLENEVENITNALKQGEIDEAIIEAHNIIDNVYHNKIFISAAKEINKNERSEVTGIQEPGEDDTLEESNNMETIKPYDIMEDDTGIIENEDFGYTKPDNLQEEATKKLFSEPKKSAKARIEKAYNSLKTTEQIKKQVEQQEKIGNKFIESLPEDHVFTNVMTKIQNRSKYTLFEKEIMREYLFGCHKVLEEKQQLWDSTKYTSGIRIGNTNIAKPEEATPEILEEEEITEFVTALSDKYKVIEKSQHKAIFYTVAKNYYGTENKGSSANCSNKNSLYKPGKENQEKRLKEIRDIFNEYKYIFDLEEEELNFALGIKKNNLNKNDGYYNYFSTALNKLFRGIKDVFDKNHESDRIKDVFDKNHESDRLKDQLLENN